MELYLGEYEHLVDAFPGHGSAIGVDRLAFSVLRVNPDVLNLSRGRGWLLPCYYVKSDAHDDQHSGKTAVPQHVARAFGQVFAAGSIVQFRGFLLK